MERGGSAEGAAPLRAADAPVRVSERRERSAAAGGGGFVSEVLPNQPRRTSMVSLWRLISLLLLVAVFYFVGKQLGRDFKELKSQQIRLEVEWIYLAAAIICL